MKLPVSRFVGRPVTLTVALAPLALVTLAQPVPAQDVVNVFNWSDYIGETTLEDFTAETGIAVNYDVYDSNEVLEARLFAGNTGFDIVVPTMMPFFARQVRAGLYQELDRSKIPNWEYLDPDLMAKLAEHDPDNRHGVVYQWGTNGFGYNVDMISARLPEAPVNSLDMVFNPDVVQHFADCGVTMLDSPTEIFPMVLHYLGREQNDYSEESIAAVVALMESIRPHVRYFHSSQYINDLANGEICLAIGWSGDVAIAAARAEEAGTGHQIQYVIPEEGTIIWFDILAVPADAPNPDAAHAFINHVLSPTAMAGITNYVWYGNPIPASLAMVDDEVKNDPSIFPPPEVQAKLFVVPEVSPREDRARTRAWTRIKTGR